MIIYYYKVIKQIKELQIDDFNFSFWAPKLDYIRKKINNEPMPIGGINQLFLLSNYYPSLEEFVINNKIAKIEISIISGYYHNKARMHINISPSYVLIIQRYWRRYKWHYRKMKNDPFRRDLIDYICNPKRIKLDHIDTYLT
jgi:hypothetical protein